MKKYIYYFVLLLSITACSKSSGGSSDGTQVVKSEAPIVFSFDIDPGSGNIFGALASNQAVNVNVTSTMPSSGVHIDLVTKRDIDALVVSSSSTSSVSAVANLVISNLQSGELCTSTITITSKSKSTNLLVKSFKIVKK